MTHEVVTVRPETSIADLAKLMLENHISGIPVTESGRLIGIVTEGDLMRRAELAARQWPWQAAPAASAEEQAQAYVKARGLKVRDVMTLGVVTIGEREPLDEIARVFQERGIKRAPVVHDGRLVGIVSRANLLQGLATAKATEETDPGDAEIRSAIMAAARDEAGVRAPLVDVTVANGIAHLWGNVASEAEREAVRVAAETTKGVREVRNHLRLLPSTRVEWKPE
jgi:CBS domain-containing protein